MSWKIKNEYDGKSDAQDVKGCDDIEVIKIDKSVDKNTKDPSKVDKKEVKNVNIDLDKKVDKTKWTFKCTLCSAKFDEKEDITIHNKSEHQGKKFFHSENGGLKCFWALECTKCFSEFSSKPKLIEHAKKAHGIKIDA